jgi:protease-4
MRFFSTLVAATLGTLVAFGVVFFVLLLFVVAIASTAGGASEAPRVADGSVVELTLGGSIPEYTTTDALSEALGEERDLDLLTVRRTLKMVAADPRVDVLWLRMNPMSAPWATLEEVRDGLMDVQAAGKTIYATSEGPYLDEASYFLASAADSVFAAPLTFFEFNGFQVTPTFYKGLLDRLDVNVEVIRAGTFKAAVEPFTRTDLSPENREQLEALLSVQYDRFAQAVAQSRGTTPERIKELMNSGIITVESAQEAGLLDGLLFEDQIGDVLRARLGIEDADERIDRIGAMDYAATDAEDAGLTLPGDADEGEIAVVYAVGTIIDGEGALGSGFVGDETFREAMEQARESERVKAVVVRINSPGGSASASEAMRHQVLLTRAEKPVVVSMGDYAASGGYWIASGADTLIANPLTITGSIGVFSLQFKIGEALNENLGLTFGSVQTGPFADMVSLLEPLDPAERARFQASIDRTYGLFLERAADTTPLTPEQVDAVAQGRVWTGAQAHELRLVDRLGTLGDALDVAARQAGFEPSDLYRVRLLPRPQTFAERLAEQFGGVFAGKQSAARAALPLPAQEAANDLERLFRQNGAVQALLPTRLTIR